MAQRRPQAGQLVCVRRALGITLLFATGLCQAADARQLRALWQSILSSENDSSVPPLNDLDNTIMKSYEAITREDRRVLIPLALRCAHSPRLKLRESGMILLLWMGGGRDGSTVMDPYIDEIGGFLKQPDEQTRIMAIDVLRGIGPEPHPKALEYLAAHMSEKNTSVSETLSATAALLTSSSAPLTLLTLEPAVVHRVLIAARERNNPAVTAGVLRQLGQYQIPDEEALRFIEENLTNATSDIRQAAVEGAGRMNKETKGRFSPELRRTAANLEETPG